MPTPSQTRTNDTISSSVSRRQMLALGAGAFGLLGAPSSRAAFEPDGKHRIAANPKLEHPKKVLPRTMALL